MISGVVEWEGVRRDMSRARLSDVRTLEFGFAATVRERLTAKLVMVPKARRNDKLEFRAVRGLASELAP